MGIPLDPNKKYIKRDIWTQHTWSPLDYSSPYIEDGKIYRDIAPKQKALYNAVRGGLLEKYAQEGFIPNHTYHPNKNRLEMERIPWVAFPPNYCLWQKRDLFIHAIKFMNRVMQDRLHVTDMQLSQMCFHYNKPVWYDIGAIGTNNGTFIKKMHRDAKRFLNMDLKSTSVNGIFKELQNYFPSDKRDPMWDTYSKNPNILPESDPECAFISKWIDAHSTKSVLDAGCNKGRLAKFVAHHKSVPVLACDTAPRCVEHLYKFSIERSLPITSLVWDIMVPPHIVDYAEMKCDMFIGSSLSHHIYRAGHNFVEQAKVIRGLAKKTILYEYIDAKTDPHVSRWGVNWTRDEFEAAFNGCDILETFSPEMPSRTWYAFGV
jgi:SAM-dependent methyltransferase